MSGLLLCLACFLPTSGQARRILVPELTLAESQFHNGAYAKAVDLAESALKNIRIGDRDRISALEVIAQSQIAQAKYVEAESTLKRSLDLLSAAESDPREKAKSHIRLSDINRSNRDFPAALREAKRALEISSNDPDIQGRYYLSVGRIMFAAGYDLSAIVWLEKAEQIFGSRSVGSEQLDAYRFLSLAWSSKLNYPAALRYSEKFISAAAGTRFKHRHRQALFESATLLSSIGQNRKALAARKEGLKLSIESKNDHQARNFSASLLLASLYDGEISTASMYLKQLQGLDTRGDFSFETTLGNAIILALTGRQGVSEKLFGDLAKRENTSPFILPSWSITIAEKNKEWREVIQHNRTLLELSLAQNFREDLPRIYLSLATAYFNLGQAVKSIEYLDQALALIEEIRSDENKNLSLGMLEVYHTAYRLLAQIKLERPLEAFELSDHLKARLLKDKINYSPTTIRSTISAGVRQKLEIRSLQIYDDPATEAEVGKLESSLTTFVPKLSLIKPDFSELDTIPDLEGKAVISYFFTLDKRLLAFVWEKGKPVRSVSIPASEDDLETDVKNVEQKIRNRIFFKRDGRVLFDKLLRPLNLSARHLIIVPDKYLWKVPFQALSPDGERYLIEDKVLSYSPSVSILADQLRAPRPTRRTLQAFGNPSYKNQFLKHVNDEATTVARLFGSRPVLNARVSDFRSLADRSDILHFSMHAQVDNDQPLDSFLGFRETGKDGGRLSVENLLNLKLKKGSLVFLASCDTNNVLSGEGLVSLAWGMMGAGATTVLSAQWEANDKSTEMFAEHFYRELKKGVSVSQAMQAASISMIRKKGSGTHEPYYWAAFTLLGDFR